MKGPFVLVLMILVLISCSDRKPEISEPERIVIGFFDQYKKMGPKDALRQLLPTNKYISIQTTDTVAVQLERLTMGLGDYQGFERIKESSYGKSIVLYTYVVKYARQPLRFNFKFYQPGNGWRIQNFSYESEFLDELDETTRAAGLKENR